MTVLFMLCAALGVLMVDALIELALVSSMVSWLHRTANGTFAVKADGSLFNLAWKPEHLLLNQGHTANSAAGTVFVLLGTLGILILWLRRRADEHTNRISTFLYRFWVVLSVLSFLLTTAAMGFVFAVTNSHAGQKIDVSVARTLNSDRGEKYPLDTWTPQGWFSAVLDLDLADAHVQSDIARHLRIMRGWQYNLIAIFVLQLLTTVLILLDAVQGRRRQKGLVKMGMRMK